MVRVLSKQNIASSSGSSSTEKPLIKHSLSFFVVDFRWRQIFFLGGSAGKSSKSGDASTSSPSRLILNSRDAKKYRYISKMSHGHLRWLRTVHVWLLVRFTVLPLIYSCAGNTCGKLVNGHERAW